MVKDHSTALFFNHLVIPQMHKGLFVSGFVHYRTDFDTCLQSYWLHLKEGRLQRGGRRRQERVCVRKKERGGFEHVSLPGSLLGLHSLKLFFYKGPCLAERGVPARIKRKGWASPVKDATVAMWEEKYSSLLRWLLIQFSSRQESLMNE